jgi:hypothetical protein
MEHITIQREEFTFGPISQLDVFCRCSLRRDPPYDRVVPGDIVYPMRDRIIKNVADVSNAISIEFSNIQESLSHKGLLKTKMGDIALSPRVGMTSVWEI